jgi:hypothetical protein
MSATGLARGLGRDQSKGDDRKLFLVAEAEGCDVFVEFEACWPLHNIFDEGSDFSAPTPVEEFRRLLMNAHLAIVVVADSEN